MKKFVFCALCALLMASCNAQPEVKNIPEMEYNYDVEAHEIPLYADGIEEFVYSSVDSQYLVSYADADAFDYDMLSDNGEEWYGEFIYIECSEENFYGLIKWYDEISKKKNTSEYYAECSEYCIKEVISDVPGGKNYRFYLCKINQ